MVRQKVKSKFSKYRFEIKHVTAFLFILIVFQIIMALVQKSSLNDFLVETQAWYQKYSAERLAIITSTSMELLYENLFMEKPQSEYDERRITYSFNVIFKQQLIQKSVEDISLILIKNHRLYVIDSGQKLYKFLTNTLLPYDSQKDAHIEAVNLFLTVKDKMKASEIIYSTLENNKTFNILVPFVPDGEYLGVMYMKITPDFSFLTKEVRANYDKVALIYTSLIFIGLIIIFVISSQAVKERNEALQKFYEEHQENIEKQIRLEKESLFTKRIYHTHHKAEKIIGFIKEDVRKMNAPGIEELKNKVITYSNFISRIIYDMKWYDQDINTIINPMFRTNINEVIKFIVENVFLRISSKNEMFTFKLDLDDKLPLVSVNEFVIWEILEPLIQNSIDHGNKRLITIKISTKYDAGENLSYIIIEDDGVGIKEELLEFSENGIKRIFLENESTKKVEGANSGYGCYIAYQMAVEKCGWDIDAFNLKEGGCRFILTIKNHGGHYE
ncbi:MAG: ATP-binding protein [Melioribacter sp.]|uniref:ATP-binding protein n=1 Tax=Rosettibacter primus TaxID=3111523 RepID=UPI00247D54F8|nr:ATP-binding protein [Melioribacter sp.]